mgnify:CR=1 FL=1
MQQAFLLLLKQPTQMKMKKIGLIAFTLTLSLAALAQGKKATSADVERFFKSTTSVLIFNENKMVDLSLKDNLTKHWKVTPLKYVDSTEFENLRTDAKNSFLGITEVRYSNDKRENPYYFLALSVGGNAATYADMPDLGFIPFGTTLDEALDNMYMLPTLLDFLQMHVQNLKMIPGILEESLRFYNKNVEELANKTILICKDDVTSGVSPERMDKKNKNEIRFVSREEIVKAVEERRPNTVVSFLVCPKGEVTARCYKMLFGTDDAKLYFYGYHKTNKLQKNGFTRWDIERIARY